MLLNMPYVIIFIIALTVIPQLPLDALPFDIPVPDFVIALAVAAIIRVAVYVKGKNAKKYQKNVEYGPARWGTEKDIKPYIDPNPKNNIILTQTESLTMNSRPKPVKYARNKNVLVIGVCIVLNCHLRQCEHLVVVPPVKLLEAPAVTAPCRAYQRDVMLAHSHICHILSA